MSENKVGRREEWQGGPNELARLEAEQAERNEEIKSKRLDLPWVPVDKEYESDTGAAPTPLAELFDGPSHFPPKNIIFAPGNPRGPCPGCTGLADGLDGSL